MGTDKKMTVNITPTASVAGLREKLELEAQRRGLNFRQFVGDIYTFAVNHKSKYQGALDDPREKGGKHIGALVTEQTAKELTSWAQKKKTSRGEHCRYIIEKTLEDNLLDEIYSSS